MLLVVPREPGIASLPRRTAAAAIDVAILVPGVAAAGVAAFVVTKRSGRGYGWWSETGFDPKWGKRWNPYVMSLSAGLAVIGRNWRTPGMRIVGIRRVDARTRGSVHLHTAILGTTVNALVAQLGREHVRPILERWEANRLAANEEIERLRESRPDADADELMRDSLEIQRRHNVGGGPLARRTLVRPLIILAIAVINYLHGIPPAATTSCWRERWR
jgi:hypothetical protein